MKQGNVENLEQAIELLVRDHVKAYEAELRAQLQRSLTSCGASRKHSSTKSSSPQSKKSSPRRMRTTKELVEISERFYQVLQGCPGETMSVLSTELGLTPKQLERPVGRLKKDGRVRSIGERSNTRYFPMTPSVNGMAPSTPTTS